jgi:GAF domain-containing protein
MADAPPDGAAPGGHVRDDIERAIHDAVASILAATQLDDVIAITRHAARALTGADGVTFVLRAGAMCYYVDEEAIGPLWKGQRFPLEECISGWVMRHRESVTIADIYQDPRIPLDAYRPTFVRSLLMVPVRKADPIAAIGAYWTHTHVPTIHHVRVVELLAEAAGTRLSSGQRWARLRETIA